jgi:SAM-dependent methyltransferase
MSQWRCRLNRESSPAHRLEHELRYALVAQLVSESELWVDLGCGTGVAAAAGLDGRLPERAILVDVDEDALAEAGGELPGAEALRADLGSAEGVAAVRDALGDAQAIVTCFQTLAHLEDFVPCVELLVGLGERCSVVLSVPNDAFWPVANPFHLTMWGEGAVDELRRLLPHDHFVLEQVPLAASAIVGAGEVELALGSARVTAKRVPSDFVLAFGTRAGELAPVAATRLIDSTAQRRYERKRDSELAVLAARVAELEQAG